MTIVKLEQSGQIRPIRHRLTTSIRRTTATVLDLLYPPQCVLCHRRHAASNRPLCFGCKEATDTERARPSCPSCAAGVALYEVSNGRCSECRRRPVRVAGSVRVGPYRVGSYRGPLGQLLRAYKYHGREELEPLLGGWLAEVVEAAPWRDRVEAVVPVPTHWRRRIMRPFYPAERLAAFVAKRMGLPLVPIIRRTRTGPKQIGLTYTDRVINVHGAFAVRSGISLDNARLLIVDDVKTTGATINECARVLRRAGAAELYAAFVVRAGWQQALGGPLSAI